MSFVNRAEAGQKLSEALRGYRGRDVVVLALPRGGVPVAREIALALHAPLDLVLVRKIGVPFQPELAMGAVADGPTPLTVRNEDVISAAGISGVQFNAVQEQELAEIKRRRVAYLGGRPRQALAGRVAIVVDDGIATGATTRAALRSVRRQHPSTLVLAVPVAPTSSLAELGSEADEIVCLERHDAFSAIGVYYSDFSQVTDAEVRAILDEFAPAQHVARDTARRPDNSPKSRDTP